eukprot:GAHX01001498.1.p1 GENE.GAHX01001498.1~~GAHX01001498.1.p1  ORF type:complete len:559 (-),score=75.29 GAHX01001498.1:51-1727(-)
MAFPDKPTPIKRKITTLQSPPGQFRRNHMTLKKKIQIIGEWERGATPAELATSYNRARSSISTILASAEKLKKLDSSNTILANRKRLRKSPFDKLETPLYEFFKELQNSGLPINGNILKFKARDLANELEVENFNATPGWFEGFKSRFGLRRIRICGEAASVDENIVENWKNEVLPELIRDYMPRDIYNVDESAFYWKILSHHTYGQRGKAASGLKQDKSRATLIFMTNMDGSDVCRPLVIGHSAKPRCFAKNQKLPCVYKNNDHAWCTTSLFNDYVYQFNEIMRKQSRYVLLFLDNCSAHSKDLTFSNVKLQFFPPNTTSILQPLDRGIIAWVKRKYTDVLITKFLHDYISEQESKITLLDAINWICSIWKTIDATTIHNCFRSAGFAHFFDVLMGKDEEYDANIIMDSATFVKNKINKLDLPVSEPIKAQLVEFIKEFEEGDSPIASDWEMGESTGCNNLVPLENYQNIALNSISNSKSLRSNDDYNEIIRESISKSEFTECLNKIRTYVLDLNNDKIIDKWFYQLYQLEKDVNDIPKKKKKIRNQNFEQFLRPSK